MVASDNIHHTDINLLMVADAEDVMTQEEDAKKQPPKYELDLDSPTLAIARTQAEAARKIVAATNNLALQRVAKEFADSLQMPYSQVELARFTIELGGLADTIGKFQQHRVFEALKPVLEVNKIYHQQFGQSLGKIIAANNTLALRLHSLVAMQDVARANLAVFAKLSESLIYNAKIALFAVIESIGKFMPALTIINQSFTVKLSTLIGQQAVGPGSTVDVAVDGVYETQGRAAVGGSVVTYKERGDFVLMKRGDFELLVHAANDNQGLKQSVDEIKAMLGAGTHDSTLLQVNAKFSKLTAELRVFGKTITIGGNSLQGSLCEVLFNSEESLTAEWHIDDLLATEEFGVREVKTEERQGWIDKAYQWARQLNMKIAAETGKQDFIKVRDQKIYINPRYLK